MTITLIKHRVEAATVSLQKVAAESPIDLGDVCAQVDVSADRSSSAANQWPDVYQEAIERALALSLTGLDDDQQVPFFAFDHDIVGEEILTEDNFEGFVKAFHAGAGRMGGTAYSPVLRKLLGEVATTTPKRRLFGRKEAQVQAVDERDLPPSFHLIFTDGAPSPADRGEIERLITTARTRPHFFQFVLIGGDEAGEAYLQRLNRQLTGAGIDNVGLTIYKGMPSTDDVAFFNDTIREFFLEWLPAARQAGITRR